MKAKFIGDPNDDFSGPKVLKHQGAFFPKDKFVGVSDTLAAKLATSNHFEVEKGDAPPYEPSEADRGAADAAKAKVDEALSGAPTSTLTKAEILERLKGYPNAEFDAGANKATLLAVLEDAEFAAGDE